MRSWIKWFEIPVSDMDRAKTFYESIFQIKMQPMELGNGLKMSLFPTQDEEDVGGALCMHPDFYEAGMQGPLLYLKAPNGIDSVLAVLQEAGGHVLVPKTQISEERGFMAVIEDTEGNRIALSSMD